MKNIERGDRMEKEESAVQTLSEELNTSLILTDMKSRIVQTLCNLIDDEVYTKIDAVYEVAGSSSAYRVRREEG
ncbi:hypothetical protein ACUL41_03630 [Virgibacillus natechei]